MPKIASSFDGVTFAEWRMEGDHLVRSMRQPSEDAILDFNNELQKNDGALKDLDWAQWIGSIPENVFWYLVKNHDPELNAPHGPTRTAAWLRLMNNRDFTKLRVRDRSMARG